MTKVIIIIGLLLLITIAGGIGWIGIMTHQQQAKEAQQEANQEYTDAVAAKLDEYHQADKRKQKEFKFKLMLDDLGK